MPSPFVPHPLPLPLFNQIGSATAATLPLPFKRRLGSVPSPDGPATIKVSQEFGGSYSDLSKRHLCLSALNSTHREQINLQILWDAVTQDAGCYRASTIAMHDLVNCERGGYSRAPDLVGTFGVGTSNVLALKYCGKHRYVGSVAISESVTPMMPFGNGIQTCQNMKNGTTIGQSKAIHVAYKASNTMASYRSIKTRPARPVPCEYYPIPIPPRPVDPSIRPCPRFPSHRLPLHLRRRSIEYDPSILPLPFQCPAMDTIPILKAYIMLNTAAASVDGLPIEVLSASVTTDIQSFCWQGRISLYPEDFAKINIDGRAIGGEAEITLTINGENWVFLAEDYSDSREFGKKTYTVTGRSVTAKLTADYAKSTSGTINSDLYARQIADQQLAFLPFTIKDWSIADWFVPAGSYNITDKTPMDNLIDIATAAGGFVYSDPNKAEISFKPRWPAPAWEINKTSAKATIPDSVILSISGQKRVNKRCTSVFVWADHINGKGADVFRQGGDRSIRASSQIHALYTDLPVHQAAGMAALSDTGIHKTETVKLPWNEEYSIPRANIGEIWQFNEQNGYWRGLITGTDLTVENQDGAVVLWQTLTVDRYLDI